MKTRSTLLIILLIGFSVILNAQSVSPDVTNSTGGSWSDKYYRVDWSVGEMSLVTFYQNSNGMLENGFLHPGTGRPSNTNDFFANGEIMIFPNPVYTSTELNITLPQAGTITVRFTDVLGRILAVKQFDHNGAGRIERLDMRTFKNGFYFLHIELKPTDLSAPTRKGAYRLVKLSQ